MTRPFPTLPAELNSRISAIIRANPSAHQVFADLIAHFDPALQPLASKKHKLDSHIENILVKLANVSAIYPVRKKVDLVLTQNDLNMALSLIAAYTLDYNNIGIILQFNTPNKQKEHWTVCCIPEGASGQLNDNIAVFGWDASAKLAIEMGDANKPKQNTHERFMSVFARLVFARSGVVPVTSVILPPAVIDCYHRAKDGHLFISPHGLFFGLKKPFFYFPHNGSQVSIMGVTGRTFNIVVEHGDTSVEFSMIDSKQYNVIAAYIETLSAVNKIKNEDIALGDGSESDDEDYVSGAESTGRDVSDTHSLDSESIGSSESKSEDDDEQDQDDEDEENDNEPGEPEEAQEDTKSISSDHAKVKSEPIIVDPSVFSSPKRRKLEPMVVEMASIKYKSEQSLEIADEIDELE